jgi:hypothetical protein
VILWCWDELERVWEAIELLAGASWPLGEDARVVAGPGGRAWLLSRGRGWANGLPALPLRALAHLDEIRAGNRVFTYSRESKHEPIPMPRMARAVICARCKGTLGAGEPVVICAGCRSPYHPACFISDKLCASCPVGTAGVLSIPGGVS